MQWLNLIFQEGRRGRLRWWICIAEACLSDPAAWNTWRAPGIVQGTQREAHNCELWLFRAVNLCLVSLLIFTQWDLTYGASMFGWFACSSFTWTNPQCFWSSGGIRPVGEATSSVDASWKFDTNCECWPTPLTHHSNHLLLLSVPAERRFTQTHLTNSATKCWQLQLSCQSVVLSCKTVSQCLLLLTLTCVLSGQTEAAMELFTTAHECIFSSYASNREKCNITVPLWFDVS